MNANKIDNTNYSTYWLAFLMCALGGIFYCYEYFLRVAPSVMLPQLIESYHLTSSALGALVAYYYLAYVPLQVPVGIMMDYWGPRKILTVACLMCSFGTYFFAVSDIVWLAKVGRFLVGFGSAFAYVGVLKIASIWLPRKFFALIAGLCTFLGVVGAMSGQILMVKLVDVMGWRTTLYASAFSGIVLSLVLWLFIKEKSPKNLSTFKKLLGLNRNKLTLSQQLFKIVKNKQLWITGFIGCCSYLPLSIFAEMWAVDFLKTSGLSQKDAAFGSSLVFLGFGIGSPIWGVVSEAIHSRRLPLIIGCFFASLAASAVLYWHPSQLWQLYSLLFLVGAFASSEVLVFAIANDLVDADISATSVSFVNALVMLGGLVIQPIVGQILDWINLHSITDEALITAVSSYQKALTLLPLGLLLGSFLSLILVESYRHDHGHKSN